MKLTRITIKRYRSINNLSLDINEGLPLTICGANNTGKTNFLRALDLFFSLNKDKFNAKMDIPYDIEEGKRGGSYYTSISGRFIDGEKNIYIIIANFKRDRKTGNYLEIKATKNRNSISEKEAREIVKSHRFLFIEASNIDIPSVIDVIVDNEILPLGLDPLRKKQVKPLQLLNQFIDESKKSLKKIETEIEKNLEDV